MWQGRRLWSKTTSIMEEKGRPVHLLSNFDLVYNQNIVSFCALPTYVKMKGINTWVQVFGSFNPLPRAPHNLLNSRASDPTAALIRACGIEILIRSISILQMLCHLIYSTLYGNVRPTCSSAYGFTLLLTRSNVVNHVGLDTVQLSWNKSA